MITVPPIGEVVVRGCISQGMDRLSPTTSGIPGLNGVETQLQSDSTSLRRRVNRKTHGGRDGHREGAPATYTHVDARTGLASHPLLFWLKSAVTSDV